MSDVAIPVRKAVYALAATTIAGVLYFGWYMHDREMAGRLLWMPWLAFSLLSLAFAVLLVFAWRRHNWARWVVVVWTVLGILSIVVDWSAEGLSPIDWIIQGTIVVVELWACYQLVSPAASVWFRRVATT